MTLQTTAPLTHTTLSPTSTPARVLVREINDGEIDLSPPYQRGEQWTPRQRIQLIRSWLEGTVPGVLYLSDRSNPNWTAATEDVYSTGAPHKACVDGKQRLTTAQQWFGGQFAVPASWFKPTYIEATEATDDGPYVRFTGLTDTGRLMFERRASLLVIDYKSAATVEDEAALYSRINESGTLQSPEDLSRARVVADGRAAG
ncbi:DUF262 domain-containing protein [Streptomyces sp. NPDC002787]